MKQVRIVDGEVVTADGYGQPRGAPCTTSGHSGGARGAECTTAAPGREVDALVAERVTGDVAWDVVIEGCSRGGRPCATVTEAERYRDGLSRHYQVGAIVLHDSVPHYSTDIAAAWTVHLAMCARLFSTRLRYLDALHEESRSPEGWLPAGLHALVVLRDRFPLAICRAALAAVTPVGAGATGGEPT